MNIFKYFSGYWIYRLFCRMIQNNNPQTLGKQVRVDIIPTSDTTVEIIEND